MSFSWNNFSVRINLNYPKENIYTFWATKAGIEHWFLRFAEYKKPDGSLRNNDELVEVGDTFKWLWHGYGDETVEYGEVLEANGTDIFKFRFGKAGNCTVKLYEEQDQTIIELIQENIPDDEKGKEYYHVGCKTGWTFHFTNMKSILEGGLDLRNKDVNLKNVINS
jgi:uncharacterized protein YndB with AHSA1/START domain